MASIKFNTLSVSKDKFHFDVTSPRKNNNIQIQEELTKPTVEFKDNLEKIPISLNKRKFKHNLLSLKPIKHRVKVAQTLDMNTVLTKKNFFTETMSQSFASKIGNNSPKF